MRLINIQTLELAEFFEKDLPPYYILSHRWGENEVSYEEYVKRHNLRSGYLNAAIRFVQSLLSTNTSSLGYLKITSACDFAKTFILSGKPKVDWLWIDTCCIDKRSSSELSEAINSMYSWYHKAELCIVYLSDVSQETWTGTKPGQAFTDSAWFSRGWTLQELLAPGMIVFCDAS